MIVDWIRNLIFNWRAKLCEDLIALAYRISPKGYTPSPSMILADEIRKLPKEYQVNFMQRWDKKHGK